MALGPKKTAKAHRSIRTKTEYKNVLSNPVNILFHAFDLKLAKIKAKPNKSMGNDRSWPILIPTSPI